MKFIFKHNKLGIKNSCYAIITDVKVNNSDSELEILKKAALNKAINYTDDEIVNNRINKGYKEILKDFKQNDLTPAGENVIKLIRERNKFPTINTVVDAYNIVVVDSFLAIGAHDLDRIKGDIVFDFAKENEVIPAVNSKYEYKVSEGDYVYRDGEKIIAWLDVRDTDLAKITNKTKNVLLMVEGNRLTKEDEIIKYLKAACDLIIKFSGGKYEIRKLIDNSLVLSGENVLNFKKNEISRTTKRQSVSHQTTTEKCLRDIITKIIGNKEINLEHPADSKFGDYSTNIALSLAKDEKKNPREVAEKIKEEILRSAQNDKTNAQDDKTIIDKIEVAGPGFINFYLTKNYLKEKAEEINFEIEFKNKLATYGSGKTMVIDYSAPNIAKPFGIGHLRSTNIGQALYNLYKTLGWKCIGDNHLGDWGTQFGKLMVAIKKWGDKSVEKMAIADLEKLYVKFHHEAEKDESLVDQGREWFARLENGDAEAKSIWQKCIDISIQEFNRVYELLDVHIDFTLGESFYTDKMGPVIKILEKKKMLKDSQGAKIVEFEKLPPAIVTKTNETTTYFTRDLATLKYRLDTWKPELIIYEVGADQNLYFRQLFAAAEMLGWMPTEGLVHIGHGLIRWKTGKFSTRTGDTIHLEDVIDKAMTKSKEIADKTAITKGLTAGEKEAMIKEVAIGAIKFNDLKSDPKKDIIFDWEQMMNLEGDSGPYVQYTHARICSVLEKTTIKEQKDIDEVPEKLTTQEEKLLKLGYQFEGKIVEAAANFNPAILAEYLLTVARTYNEFYATNKIIGDKAEVWRIFLTKTTQSILHQGLVILGIKPLEKM